MSWSFSINDGEPMTLHEYLEIRSCVVAAYLAQGAGLKEAMTFGTDALIAAKEYEAQRRKVWSTQPVTIRQTLPDGSALEVRSNDLPEDPTRQCRNLRNNGSRCGRSLNHIGEC